MRINNAVSGVWHSISLCRWNFSDYIILCYFFFIFFTLSAAVCVSLCLCVPLCTLTFCWRRFYLFMIFNQSNGKCFVALLLKPCPAMLHLFKISDAMRCLNILYFHSCYIDWPTWLSKVTTIFTSINMKSTKSKTETFFSS